MIPSDAPSFEPVEFDADQLLEEALVTRPEMYTAKQAIRDQELRVRNARRRLLPTADLNIRGTSSGDSFVLETFMNDDFTESVSEIPDVVNYNYRIGLSLSVPLGNKAAKAGYAIADLELQKTRFALTNQELTIRTEVRSAVRGVTSGLKSIEAAKVTVELREKSLDAERKKMDNGMSTSFQVLEVQNDLADAELSEIRAVLNYNKSLVTLEKSRGTLLTARGLKLD